MNFGCILAFQDDRKVPKSDPEPEQLLVSQATIVGGAHGADAGTVCESNAQTPVISVTGCMEIILYLLMD